MRARGAGQPDSPRRRAIEPMDDASPGKGLGGAGNKAIGLLRTNARYRGHRHGLAEDEQPLCLVQEPGKPWWGGGMVAVDTHGGRLS